jgi:hypothetical protein
LGPSVYTRGGIYAEGAIDISGGATIYGGETVYGGETIATGDLNVSSGNIVVAKQIRSTTVTDLGIYNGGTNVTIDCSLGQIFKITLNANLTSPYGVTASNLTPGAHVYVIVTANGANRSIDFNGPFNTVNVGVRTITNTYTATFSFICDGTTLYQIGEAINLSA